MRYFTNCTTVEAAKKLYRELAFTHHPDKGGDVEIMKAINNEYAYIIALIASGAYTAPNEAKYTAEQANSIIDDSEAYQAAINAIIMLPLTIEIVGNWIWVSGNTFPYKTELKAAGYMWASAKKMWFFRTDEYKATSGGKRQSIDDIKAKYGSSKIANKTAYAIQ